MNFLNITINITEKNNGLHVDLHGEIDAYTAPELRDKLFQYTNSPGVQMVVDLSGITYMDSTGLGVFVGLFKALKANEGKLNIIGLSERLKRLFDITGLADVMDINTEVEGGV